MSRDQMNMGLMFPNRMRVAVLPQNINHTHHKNVNKNSPESHNIKSDRHYPTLPLIYIYIYIYI